jgi:hypothetical protein
MNKFHVFLIPVAASAGSAMETGQINRMTGTERVPE